MLFLCAVPPTVLGTWQEPRDPLTELGGCGAQSTLAAYKALSFTGVFSSSQPREVDSYFPHFASEERGLGRLSNIKLARMTGRQRDSAS